MGHKSIQEVDASSTIVGSATQTNYVDCATYANGGNSMQLDGDGNIVSGVDQTYYVSVDSDCTSSGTLNFDFSSRIQNSIDQEITDQEIALTQWLDNSKDSAKVSIDNSLTLNLLQENSMNCENSLDGSNIIGITGDSNVVKNVTQDYTVDTLTTCHLKDNASFKAISSMTDTLNQHNVYTSVNPFAFITDAIVAVVDSAVLLVAFCFIVLLCFIGLFAVLRHRSKSKQRAAAVAAGLPPTSVH